MVYLIIVSFVWAFSFGLIKGNLAGLDPNFVSFARMLISFLVFAPFFRFKDLNPKLFLKLMVIGAFQYGFMYVTYISAFQYLKAYQVAVFTIFTPLYVTLIHDLIDKRFHLLFFFMALFAIVGTGIIVYDDIQQYDLRTGFLLIQISNICFAFGQIFYKKLMCQQNMKDQNVFAILYFGALVITALSAGITTDWDHLRLTSKQIVTLLYLGVIASGICFFLWNYGATKTDAGALAICNNLKVPLAVVCSLVFFHEQGNIPRLLIGGGIILGALFINEAVIMKAIQKK